MENEIKRKKKEIENSEKKEQEKQYLAIMEAKKEVLEQSMLDLPKFLEEKNKEIVKEIAKIPRDEGGLPMGTPAPIIINALSKGMNFAGVTPKYNAQTLYLAFEHFKEAVDNINREIAFIPSKQSLASYLGISVTTLNMYKKSQDPYLREQAEIIEDYLIESSLMSSQMGVAKEKSTMFRLKAEKVGFGIKEAQSNVQIEVKKTTVLSKEEMIDKLKSTGAIIDIPEDEIIVKE